MTSLEQIEPAALEVAAPTSYLYLAQFQALSTSVEQAQSLAAKTVVSDAAGRTLVRHQAMRTLLADLGADAADAMKPYVDAIEAFERRVRAADWHERVLTAFLSGEVLTEFYRELAERVREPWRARLLAVLGGGPDMADVRDMLNAEFDAHEGLRDTMSLWGRRLLGDTLLVAKDALQQAHAELGEFRLDSLFKDVVSTHAKRMGELGLSS